MINEEISTQKTSTGNIKPSDNEVNACIHMGVNLLAQGIPK